MPNSEKPLFVVILTDEGQLLAAPRAVGPFDNWDIAQAFAETLLAKWKAQDGAAPVATVVRVETAMAGIVVGGI